MQITAYLFVKQTEAEVYPFLKAVIAEQNNFCYTARLLQKHVQESKENNYFFDLWSKLPEHIKCVLKDKNICNAIYNM